MEIIRDLAIWREVLKIIFESMLELYWPLLIFLILSVILLVITEIFG